MKLKLKILYTGFRYYDRLRQGLYRKKFRLLEKICSGKTGIEIGGPTQLFREKFFSVYDIAGQIDGVNFSANTVWAKLEGGKYTYGEGRAGKLFEVDAVDMDIVPAATYDFLLSSHNLEHIANPLKAVAHWHRVLKPGGYIILILPDKRFTFDHKRPYTRFDHILSDYNQHMQENDLTHLEEVLALSDNSYQWEAPKAEAERRADLANNLQTRTMHHHVFDAGLVQAIFDYTGFEMQDQYFKPPFHDIYIGRKK
ncbi:MAG: class I SAM-dependent methyltransferase [Ferruginibacter sp.]